MHQHGGVGLSGRQNLRVQSQSNTLLRIRGDKNSRGQTEVTKE